MKQLSERDLDSLKQGSTEPLTGIFRSVYQACKQQVRQLTRCQDEDAEDMVMDALIVLREKVMHGEYENENLQPFLVSVAVNKWKNQKRKNNRISFLDVNDMNHIRQKLHQEGDHLKDHREREAQAIRIALEQSTGKCGQLLRRNLYDGISLEMLVSELEYKSYSVIKTTKSRCMKKLRLAITQILNQNHE